MKLTRKLTLYIAFAVIAVLSLGAFIRIQGEARLYEADLTRDHDVLGRALSAAVSEAWRVRGRALALDVVAHSDSPDDPVHLRWVDTSAEPRGLHTVGFSPGERSLLSLGQVVHRVVPEPTAELVSYVPLSGSAGQTGALEISESLTGRDQFLRRIMRSTLLLTAAIGGVCILLAFGLGTWIVGRPVRALRDKARSVGAGDFETPVRLSQDDELGELAREMNAMGDQLSTAKRHTEAAMNERAQALEQLRHVERLATVGRLASGVAHELGTPLNVIQGHARLIETGQADDIGDSAAAIARQTQRITLIIRQLLDFSRPRSAVKAPADLVALARETAAMLKSSALKAQVSLEVESPDGAVSASVDESQILQVLTNLVLNAIQASSCGERIVLRVSRPDDARALVEVVDAGHGMTAEVMDHLFEPFFTTKEVGMGTGLGLAVSYGIVQDHRGKIAAHSVLGQGTTFSLLLPRGDEACRAA
ncbi:MAG: HAMP domain-containing protein [Myxococcales bacterium]|nr:HAMP domain-containing protein [Myxococcales bacterium]